MKRIAIALAVMLALASQALAAGTISFSLSQQLDANGKPLANCFLYFIQAGTTATPQNAYKDTALTLPHPNPMRCDAAGRLEQFYLADGQIKIRLTDKNSLPQVTADNLLVIGPSSGGGGGGGSVDPTTIMATGDVKARYSTGSLSGFVRMNGRTIGNASSGGTERANADTQALFEYLCANDNNLVMTPARSGNCSNDYAANKVLAVPDFRSRVLGALGDMGNTDNALLSGVTFTSGNSTTLGALLGTARKSLVTANLPPYSPSGSIVFGGSIPITINSGTPIYGGLTSVSTGTGSGTGVQSIAQILATASIASLTGSLTGTAQGGTSTAFDTISPLGLVTFYMKL